MIGVSLLLLLLFDLLLLMLVVSLMLLLLLFLVLLLLLFLSSLLLLLMFKLLLLLLSLLLSLCFGEAWQGGWGKLGTEKPRGSVGESRWGGRSLEEKSSEAP